MRFLLRAALAVLAVAPGALAQTVPARGSETTFDVASWNLENFGVGSGAAAEVQTVAAVIRQAEVDLWALQEVSDANDFAALLSELDADGYAGFIGPAPRLGGDQRLAFIYKEEVVTRIVYRSLFSEEEYAFAYRLPIEFRASVSVGGETRSIWFVNLHAKCCGSSEDYDRRVAGAGVLKAYADSEAEGGRALVVLGDFNDRLNQSTAGGLSPYRPFYTDTEDYTIATRDLDSGAGTPTYCSNSTCTSGTPLDHILFTSALAPAYVEGSGDRYVELVSAVDRYTSAVSDHLPVLAQFTFASTAADADAEAGPVALLAPAPSPFRETTALRFRLGAPAEVALDVVDVLGRRVARLGGSFGAGEHAVRLDGRGLAPGVYVVRLEADGEVRARTLVRTR